MKLRALSRVGLAKPWAEPIISTVRPEDAFYNETTASLSSAGHMLICLDVISNLMYKNCRCEYPII